MKKALSIEGQIRQFSKAALPVKRCPLIHQSLLSGYEAFRADGRLVRGKKADNRKLFLWFKGL
jgi:hypothetical protein